MSNTKFPQNFLWGASSAAFQFEGGYNQDGKGESVQDHKSPKHYPSGITDFKDASDHYNHWEEDVDLMAEMGFKSYRFSIAWTRILPDGTGKVNPKGIEFYNNLINALIKNKIEPVVTMYHFDMPTKLQKEGGWLNVKTTDAFEEYAKVLFDNFGDRIKYWLTINELNIEVLAADTIGTVLEDVDYGKYKWQVFHYLNLAQAKAINLLHKMCPNAKIGPVPSISPVYADTSKSIDQIARFNMDMLRNWIYVDVTVNGKYGKIFLKMVEKQRAVFNVTDKEMEIIAQGKPDFIAFNYYSTLTVKMPDETATTYLAKDQQTGLIIPGFGQSITNKNMPKTHFGWEIDPIGFRLALREVYNRYNLPVIVVENGIGSKDVISPDGKIHDDYRIDYHKQHIEQMALAIDDGVEMIGYMPWSAIDLVSSHEGITKRYGFVYVDRTEDDLKDCKRIRKDSFFYYKDVIKSNGEKT